MDKLGWRFNVVSGIPIISKEFCSTSENWSFGRYSTSLSSSVTFPSWKINDVINSKHLCYENIQCILLELSRSIPFWRNGSTQDVIDGPNCRLVLKQYNQRKKNSKFPSKNSVTLQFCSSGFSHFTNFLWQNLLLFLFWDSRHQPYVHKSYCWFRRSIT